MINPQKLDWFNKTFKLQKHNNYPIKILTLIQLFMMND